MSFGKRTHGAASIDLIRMVKASRTPMPHPEPTQGGRTSFVPEGRSALVALTLVLSLGLFAAHRFYLLRTRSALVWLGLVLIPGVPFFALLTHVCTTSDCKAAGTVQLVMQVTSIGFFVGLGAIALWATVDTVRLLIASARQAFAS